MTLKKSKEKQIRVKFPLNHDDKICKYFCQSKSFQ